MDLGSFLVLLAVFVALAIAIVFICNHGSVIELLQDAEGGGVVFEGNGRTLTIDFNGFTYTVTNPTVGSAGTETNGFQLLKGNAVTLKNGALKAGSSDGRKPWFAVGEYKRMANEVGGQETTLPEDVPSEMKKLLETYNSAEVKTLDDLLDFHVSFERIHPFQDGNGRVGRLILFKECLHWDIVPFIITDDLKMFYYRGLREWPHVPGYLTDTCLSAQDNYKSVLDYFRIKY